MSEQLLYLRGGADGYSCVTEHSTARFPPGEETNSAMATHTQTLVVAEKVGTSEPSISS